MKVSACDLTQGKHDIDTLTHEVLITSAADDKLSFVERSDSVDRAFDSGDQRVQGGQSHCQQDCVHGFPFLNQ